MRYLFTDDDIRVAAAACAKSQSSIELEPIYVAQASGAARRGVEDHIQVMNAACSGHFCW